MSYGKDSYTAGVGFESTGLFCGLWKPFGEIPKGNFQHDLMVAGINRQLEFVT
jgi:hypothetical protein